MKQFCLDSADFIKCHFIDFLLSKNSKIIIGNEVMYGTKRNVVDLINIQNDKITAIEIKSNNDTLSRIYNQIEEYRKIFNYVIIVTTDKFKEKILTSTTNDIGIYIINSDFSISLIRKPKLQKERIKLEMLYSINSKFLMKLGNFSYKKVMSDKLCQG